MVSHSLCRFATRATALVCLASFPLSLLAQSGVAPQVFGYRDFSQQRRWDALFMGVPSADLARAHLKELTKAPHWASSPEDYATAQYVAEKFKAAGLDTEIVPYRVYMNKPKQIVIEGIDESGKVVMHGPTPEHVEGDPFQNDPRIFTAFNGSAPSGDVTGEVVYANYGTLADFKKLRAMGVDLKGKIAIVRYSKNFRGVKVYIAQQLGMAGVLIYSDPADDGYAKGDMYPKGSWRPETGVQRGSVQFIAKYTGDPMTPGVASTTKLSDKERLPADKLQQDNPSIPANPISYHDAEPILSRLGGPATPRDWQGALPFTYHIGSVGPASSVPAVKAHLHLEQDYAVRTIWNVIGKIRGTEDPNAWVVAGNHRDAWVFGAVDPSSGTATMLETVHGLGELLKKGWKPKRTIVIGSWDAEEEGLIGSTEWCEEHAKELAHAVAYFNTDVAVSGPHFTSDSVPSLKQFVREVTQQVSSPAGGTVYDAWKRDQQKEQKKHPQDHTAEAGLTPEGEVRVGNLGSGSDYTPFLQHTGVPATDIGSNGDYGVYHSVFDNYAWFEKFGDPEFKYLQQQARVFGLEVLHMADADVLPYDYALYGKEIVGYVDKAERDANNATLALDFTDLKKAAARFHAAGADVRTKQTSPAGDARKLNAALREAEQKLLSNNGLPNRPWYKHTVYAPGLYTGYAAVVIPGITEAIDGGLDKPDAHLAQAQIAVLTKCLNDAADVLESAAK